MEFSPKDTLEIAKDIGYGLFCAARLMVANVVRLGDDSLDVWDDCNE